MGNDGKKEETVEMVNIKLPRRVLEFADFYAALGNEERENLLSKILISQLREIRDKFKDLPYVELPEIW